MTSTSIIFTSSETRRPQSLRRKSSRFLESADFLHRNGARLREGAFDPVKSPAPDSVSSCFRSETAYS